MKNLTDTNDGADDDELLFLQENQEERRLNAAPVRHVSLCAMVK